MDDMNFKSHWQINPNHQVGNRTLMLRNAIKSGKKWVTGNTEGLASQSAKSSKSVILWVFKTLLILTMCSMNYVVGMISPCVDCQF